MPHPLKEQLGYPLSAEAARKALCHPWRGHVYHLPAMLPCGAMAAANGFMAVVCEKFALPAPVDASPEFLARWDERVKWGGEEIWSDEHEWKPLADVTGTLFKYGPRPAFFKGSLNWHPRLEPAVGIGHEAIIPLAMLQLASRLPRAEVLTETFHSSPVRIRFNGGRAMIANLSSDPKLIPSFWMFRKPASPI